MKRERKYRVWDGKKMCYPHDESNKWDGMYSISLDGIVLMENNGTTSPVPHVLNDFTGLIDKSGKEIYEDDIIGNKEHSSMEPKRVVFYNGSFGFWDKENSIPEFFMLYRYLHSREVIGNIYLNPELLK